MRLARGSTAKWPPEGPVLSGNPPAIRRSSSDLGNPRSVGPEQRETHTHTCGLHI